MKDRKTVTTANLVAWIDKDYTWFDGEERDDISVRIADRHNDTNIRYLNITSTQELIDLLTKVVAEAQKMLK